MIILLSPAKIQNFKPQTIIQEFSEPHFMADAGKLVKLMRGLSPAEISSLLDINSKLTELNFERYFNWHTPFTPENAKQAALVFDGEVFRGLNAGNFSNDDFEFAQQHLIILSGLYGALRPLDLIQPYRLEISSALENKKGKDLYAYWKKPLTDYVISQLKSTGDSTILNLASAEYFKALDLKNRKINVIDVEFLEYKNDQLKPIVIYTKKARGLMARFLITNRIQQPDDMKAFADAGYWYSPQHSTANKFVFIR